jgi:hypothetical protein
MMTATGRIQRPGEPDAFKLELAQCEPALNGCRALRLTLVVAAPLVAALCLPTGWLVGVCWLVALWLFFPLLRGWGYSYLAVFLAVFPWYILMTIEQPPVWGVAACIVVTLAMLRYMRRRLQRIHLYRVSLGCEDQGAYGGRCYRI